MPTVSGSGAGGDLFHLTECERLQREQTDLTLQVLPTFDRISGLFGSISATFPRTPVIVLKDAAFGHGNQNWTWGHWTSPRAAVTDSNGSWNS